MTTMDTLHEEAARYALPRRIAPTLRHHLAGEFQPLGMMAALLERRLQQDPLGGLHEQCASLGQLSRQAAAHCMDLMNWVAPREASVVALDQAVADCVHILATGLRFRGFALLDQTAGLSSAVCGPSLCSVLPAAVLYLSDSSAGPADLRLRAEIGEGLASVIVDREAADRPVDPATEYRPLQWADVLAIAQAESVALERWDDSVRLSLKVCD